MFHIVLFEPEIPPNTGNIIRLCANTGSQLHLIEPLGFDLDDKKLRRAGLDYDEFAAVKTHASFREFYQQLKPVNLYGLSTHGQRSFYAVNFEAGDAFIFGPETRGLPSSIRQELADNLLRVPMQANSRSLNLSNTATLVVYEAWRQIDFKGGL